jgi:radical SAM protein with 4Fe4S-binding SPASM domain
MKTYVTQKSITALNLWTRGKTERLLNAVTFELTRRCNNRCVHCYINVPENDPGALSLELPFDRIRDLVDEAASLGALWVLLTGGEPLLRKDFFDIYTYCKNKGLLVSVFTNASLITDDHIRLFKTYRPREIEVTVYGVTKQTYGRMTGRPDLFDATMAGIERLETAGLPLTLKTTVCQANLAEFHEIERFCKVRSTRGFRFEPFLNLRLDRDPDKNRRIRKQRLTPDQVVALETSLPKRRSALEKMCSTLDASPCREKNDILFKCGAGLNACTIDDQGFFRLCASLVHKDCVFDLKTGTLIQAWDKFVPKIRKKCSRNAAFVEACGSCPLTGFCMACPAHSDLETGKLDSIPAYFCRLAHERYAQNKQ